MAQRQARHPERPGSESQTFSIEAEQMVLGALLLHNAAGLGLVLRQGGAELFYDPLHARLLEAVTRKARAGALVSPVTLAEEFRADPGLAALGGAGYFARLAGAVIGAAQLADYIAFLDDLRRKRGIMAAAQEALAAISRGEGSAREVATRLEGALITFAQGDTAGGPVSMAKAVTLATEQAFAAYQGATGDCIRSGLPALDKIIGGFYPGELVLIGGRPSMGKTGVALAMALNAARAGQAVTIASLEMNPEALALRALAEATAQAGQATPYSDMRRGLMSEAQARALVYAAEEVAKLPITFLPRQYNDLGALLAGARQAVQSGGSKLLIIDYAQLIRAPGKGRYDQVTEVSLALKGLSGMLNVPVIALSQLSRNVETREDKRPMLADLRESGQLEQDADTVIFCYRDEYYLERERPDEGDLEALATWQEAMGRAQNQLELIVAKQRMGEIGTARMRFNPGTNIIWDDDGGAR